jgi:hypothetical protein
MWHACGPHPRVARVEQLGGWHLHHLRITSVDQLD